MVSVQVYKPSDRLEPFVEGYSRGIYNTQNKPDAIYQIVPNGCLELIIHLDDLHCRLLSDAQWTRTPDYMLIGLLTQVYEVRFSHRVSVFSIRFKPEALFSLFHIQGVEVVQRYEDITLLFGKDFRDFCHRLREDSTVEQMITRTEKYLLAIMERQSAATDYVARAADLMRHTNSTSIQDISDKVYISQRQLERKFKREIGISPKKYLRLLRINRVMQVLEQSPPLDLTSVAYHCGYYDQAHFIKDFKLITGQNPTVFTQGRQQFIVHPGRFVPT